MGYGRVVSYKITVSGGPLDRRALLISAIDDALSEGDRLSIRSSGAEILSDRITAHGGQLPPPTASNLRGFAAGRPSAAQFLASSFAAACVARTGLRGLEPAAEGRRGPAAQPQSADFTELLMGEQAVVPLFGSPPSAWLPLKDAMAYAAGAFAAVGDGGGVPTLLLAFGGAVVLVRFIDPIAQAVGSALADGIGAAIRKAFDLPAPPQVGELEAAPDQDASTPGTAVEGSGPLELGP
ncbi:hypothetical protein ABII15_16130 [Streptomyces sp. HUAS MG91]|uniref:Uncharacterized protein n=1 Tax=Streptomyces tabacisoli TaxID=3156398 RepID=A0AAU8IT12_9ACTN